MDELKNKINTFSFDNCTNGSQGFSRVLIQLFGLLGHGKSSFINTCMYVWEDNEYKNWAEAAKTDHGCTLKRITYPLTKNITVVDNRGYAKLGSSETGEIFAQLGNLLPLGNTVEWSKGFGLADRIVKAEKERKPSDFIVPVFIYSVKTGVNPEEVDELKHLLLTVRNLTGIYPTVVFTHKTSGKLTDTEAAFRNMGAEKTFSFENYTLEDHCKTRGRHEEVLKFLHEVVKDVQFRMNHLRDPDREMNERKKLVLNYIHEQEKKTQQSHEERKKIMEQNILKTRLKQQQEELERQKQRDKISHNEELRKTKEQHQRMRLVEEAEREQELRDKETNEKTKHWWDKFLKK